MLYFVVGNDAFLLVRSAFGSASAQAELQSRPKPRVVKNHTILRRGNNMASCLLLLAIPVQLTDPFCTTAAIAFAFSFVFALISLATAIYGACRYRNWRLLVYSFWSLITLVGLAVLFLLS